MSFAAGIMLALAFIHLIPEAIEMGVDLSEVHSSESEVNIHNKNIITNIVFSYVGFRSSTTNSTSCVWNYPCKSETMT
jgi:zinc transporter ZupT